MMTDDCNIDLSAFELVADKVHSGCRYYAEGDSVKLNSLPKNTCIPGLYTILPYYFSLKEDAWFRWEKDKDSVTAFCPIAESTVGMDILRTRSGDTINIGVRIREPNASCTRGYASEDRYHVNFFDEIKVCPRLLYEIIPYLFYLKNVGKGHETMLSLSCSGCEHGRVDFSFSGREAR